MVKMIRILKKVIAKIIAFSFPPKYSFEEKQWYIWDKKVHRFGHPHPDQDYIRYLNHWCLMYRPRKIE